MSKKAIAEQIVESPFYVDQDLPGIVRGGFFDEMGGILVGMRATYVAEALNEHAEWFLSKEGGTP